MSTEHDIKVEDIKKAYMIALSNLENHVTSFEIGPWEISEFHRLMVVLDNTVSKLRDAEWEAGHNTSK